MAHQLTIRQNLRARSGECMLKVLGTVLILLASTGPVVAQISGSKATATVKVNKPLQLTSLRNLAFGNVLLGAFTGSDAVVITSAGRNCGTSGGLTCSGTFSTAQYRVVGSNNQTVLISSTTSTVTMSNGSGGTLILTPSFPASVTLDNSGNPGKLFEVGGSLSFTSTQPDGVYSGTLDIQVAYQ